MFECLECRRKFRSVAAAERASYNGCPNCGSVDIDISVPDSPASFTDKIKLLYPEERDYLEVARV